MKRSIGAICFFVLSVSASSAQNPLKLDVTLPSRIFFVGQSIELGVGVRNVGIACVDEDLYGATTLELRDESGKELPPAGVSPSPELPSSAHLAPGEEDFRVLRLDDHFGKPTSPSNLEYYLNPGNYSLKVLLRPPHFDAESILVTFRIIWPTGDEAEVYRKFVELARSDASHDSPPEQIADSLEALHLIHPKSVYTESILTVLDAICDIDLRQHERALKFRKQLVEEYPMTVRAWQMLDGILMRMPLRADRIQMLQKLKRNADAALLGRRLESKLKAEEASD